MALILTEQDLAPLYQDPAAMDELLNLIEDSLRAHSCNEVVGQVRVETSLVDPNQRFRITTAAVPNAGQSMRINALFRGAKDGHFNLLFDGRSGALLALVAGG